MADIDVEALIDRIYEAGAVPELWRSVLDELTRLADGLGGTLIVPNTGHWLATDGIESMVADLISTGLINSNERTRRLLELEPISFYRDSDVFQVEHLPHEPVYRDFFIPRGGGLGTATVVNAPSGDRMILHVERAYADGPVADAALHQLNLLRPHLARASLVSARLQMSRAVATAAALESLGLPAVVVDRLGRAVAANPSFDALVPTLVEDRRNRIRLADPDADALLVAAFDGLDASGVPTPARSIAVPGTSEHGAAIVHVVPIRGASHDVFSMGRALVIVTPVAARSAPAGLVQGLFDLTPAEARLASALSEGQSLTAVARSTGRSIATVRNQLRALLDKTGMRRQVDLVRLLLSVGGPPL
ncbi:MAG TPA: helix-turn-helix transcriptional regulator [Devosia sp.]|nr:helix-turn-helix transcriptional regulator [Devosia sp.]